jgi:hypothetical protein
MIKQLSAAIIAVVVVTLSPAAFAVDRNWNDHARPFTFLFGNHIDTHQETRLIQHGPTRGDLWGYFYVFDSGDPLADGTPVLRHCTNAEHYAAGCVAGWIINAKPCIPEINGCEAMFLYHDDDHPVWLLGPRVDDSGALRGSRQSIVQPGSYTHMHWLTEGLDLDEMMPGLERPSSLADVESLFGVDIDVPAECNVDMASQLTSGVVCPGYFLQITVLKPFGLTTWAFHHGGESLVLQARGDRSDNKTHLNILTSYRSLPPGVLPGEYASDAGDGGHE